MAESAATAGGFGILGVRNGVIRGPSGAVGSDAFVGCVPRRTPGRLTDPPQLHQGMHSAADFTRPSRRAMRIGVSAERRGGRSTAPELNNERNRLRIGDENHAFG